MIVHQHLIRQTLFNAVKEGKVHHALLFHGPSSVGKFPLALELIKNFYCDHRGEEEACHQCESCRQIEKFQHPGVNIISSDDRITTLAFLQSAFQQDEKREQGGGGSKKILSEIIYIIRELIHRHRIGYLNRLEKMKATYPEGVVLKKGEEEKFFYQIHLYLEALEEGIGGGRGDEPLEKSAEEWLLGKGFITDMKTLQNSLDRTYIPKEKLTKIFRWTKTQAHRKKWVIIDDLNLINVQTVGVFLKNLEDPDPDSHFILISNHLNQINEQVATPLLSRCLKLHFQNLEGKVGEVLKAKFQLEIPASETQYFRNMENFFKSNLMKQRRGSVKMGGGQVDHTFFQLPLQKQQEMIDKGVVKSIDLTHYLSRILENYLKPLQEIQPLQLRLQESDVIPLIGMLDEIEETDHSTKNNPALLKILNYLKLKELRSLQRSK